MTTIKATEWPTEEIRSAQAAIDEARADLKNIGARIRSGDLPPREYGMTPQRAIDWAEAEVAAKIDDHRKLVRAAAEAFLPPRVYQTWIAVCKVMQRVIDPSTYTVNDLNGRVRFGESNTWYQIVGNELRKNGKAIAWRRD